MINLRSIFEKIKILLLFLLLSLLFFFSIIAVRYTILNSNIKEVKIVSRLKNITSQEIMSLIALSKDSTVLGYDIKTANKNLSDLPFARDVVVKKQFPNSIEVTIKEKNVIALFQENGLLYPVDEKGEVIPQRTTYDDTKNLIIVSGNGAQVHFLPIFDKVKKSPAILPYIFQIEKVENRRYNLILQDGKIVMLPQSTPLLAIEKLNTLQIKTDILNKKFKRLDLRDTKRMLIEE